MRIKLDTTLNLSTYAAVVELIAQSFFGAEGEYQPHIGMIKTMQIFYTACVEMNENLTYSSDTDDDEFVSELLSNQYFIEKFNEAICVDRIRLDFANAYRDAMDIVDTKKSTIGRLVDMVKDMIDGLAAKYDEMNNPENMNTLKTLAGQVADGSLSVDKLMETYLGSNMNREARRRADKQKKAVLPQ